MDLTEEIRQRLAALEPLLIELEDESHRHAGHAGARSGGGHFELRIVATCFAGKPTLARHRLIYAALGELMQTRIHALSILAQTPEEATQA
ncbi:BolA family protein [Uliginosibacterium aquaticum]|uniref:BolA family transcriptional regulator n=1 Tax=Uliginosibacterium aquaticum TaxID=2731212 RepID=A0ABX2IS50_9RHOO|nr:BolA family protein [Uliginosibacterium aquaticum]NSL56815.1 BolA family transcriptional regulator [Uliginosibacterium aquaticum]